MLSLNFILFCKYTGYGMTENTGVSHFSPPDDMLLGSAGYSGTNIEWKVSMP